MTPQQLVDLLALFARLGASLTAIEAQLVQAQQAGQALADRVAVLEAELAAATPTAPDTARSAGPARTVPADAPASAHKEAR